MYRHVPGCMNSSLRPEAARTWDHETLGLDFLRDSPRHNQFRWSGVNPTWVHDTMALKLSKFSPLPSWKCWVREGKGTWEIIASIFGVRAKIPLFLSPHWQIQGEEFYVQYEADTQSPRGQELDGIVTSILVYLFPGRKESYSLSWPSAKPVSR